MEDETGMYIRFNGFISKIEYITISRKGFKYIQFKEPNETMSSTRRDFLEIEPSKNITDLIEPGDVVVGPDGHKFEVYAVGSDCVYINELQEFIMVDEIKEIITKEQISKWSYKRGVRIKYD